jgi:NADPH:quinone reductase-like Zn-dependent oxidoreductase
VLTSMTDVELGHPALVRHFLEVPQREGPATFTATAHILPGQRIVQLIAAPSGPHLAALAELIDAGSVRPAVERTYPLTDAAAAIRYVESEHAQAKVVVTVP